MRLSPSWSHFDFPACIYTDWIPSGFRICLTFLLTESELSSKRHVEQPIWTTIWLGLFCYCHDDRILRRRMHADVGAIHSVAYPRDRSVQSNLLDRFFYYIQYVPQLLHPFVSLSCSRSSYQNDSLWIKNMVSLCCKESSMIMYCSLQVAGLW